MGLVDNLIAQFQQQQERANAANESRYQEGLSIFDQIIEQQKVGGASEKATEAGLDRGRTKSVAQGMQSLVSSGLSSTTTAAGLGKKYEEEVGAPTRLAAEASRNSAMSNAMAQKAGFIERREDTGPSYSAIASLATSIGRGSVRQPAPAPVSDPRSHYQMPGSFFSSDPNKIGR